MEGGHLECETEGEHFNPKVYFSLCIFSSFKGIHFRNDGLVIRAENIISKIMWALPTLETQPPQRSGLPNCFNNMSFFFFPPH